MRSALPFLFVFALGCIKNDIPNDVEDPDDTVTDADDDGFDDSVDCDDNDPAVHPDATEICDGIDNDCDEQIDAADEDAEGLVAAFLDGDEDGFGNPSTPIEACSVDDPGVAPTGDDCDDENADVFPGQEERCDSIDNDCNGLTDDDDPALVDGISFWADDDADTYGDAADFVLDCELPEGYADNDLDCNDSDPLVGAPTEWYVDADEDGFGDGVAGVACDPESAWTETDGDCDDDDADVNPDQTDYCGDGVDADCSGDTDDWGPGCIDLEPQDIIDDVSCVSDEIEFISAGFDVEGDHFSIGYGPTGNWVNESSLAGLEIKPSGTLDFIEVIYAGTALDFVLYETDRRTHAFGHPTASSAFYDVYCSKEVRQGDVIGAVHTMRRSYALPSGLLAYIDLTKKELWNEADESVLIEYSASPSMLAGSVNFTVQRFLDFDIDWYASTGFPASGTDFDSEGRLLLSTGPMSGTTVAIGACGSDSIIGSDAEWDWSPVTSSIIEDLCNADGYSDDTPTILQTELASAEWGGHPKKRFVMSIGASPSAASTEWNASADSLCGELWEPTVLASYPGGYCDGRIVVDPSLEF